MQGKEVKSLKNRALVKKELAMYRAKDREEEYLFKELMPFGGELAEDNRWINKEFNTVGRVGGCVRAEIFRKRTASVRWAVGDRVDIVKAYDDVE